MADNNLQTNPSVTPPTSAPATPVVTPPAKDDDYLDLDSIYDLDGDSASAKNQAALSANATVPAANLESFRTQSGATMSDGAADSQVLADLKAKAQLSSSATPVVPYKNEDGVVVDPNWLNKLSTAVTKENKKVDDKEPAPNPNFDFNKGSDIPRIELDQASAGSSMDIIQNQADDTKEVDDAANAKKLDKVDLDIDAAKLDYSTPSPGVSFKEIPAKPSISEAAQIEEQLNANIIDLDAELKDDATLPDLFESAPPSAPAVSTVGAVATVASSSDLEPLANDGSLPRLSKVKMEKTSISDDRRTVTATKLMKTDSIFNRSDKSKEINLSASMGDKNLKGPVQELAGLTLEDWSRLGDIPSERAAKIKEKIAALGTKSIISEVEGLNAWRSSQTHQTYLDIGVAAMLSEQSLEEIISGQKALNMEEWLTINQLNRELMI